MDTIEDISSSHELGREGSFEQVLSNVALIRLAAIPWRVLVDLRPAATAGIIERALQASSAEELARVLLDEALYDAIAASSNDGDVHRQLLKARRALRANRETRAIEEIGALPAEFAEVRREFVAWKSAVEQLSALLDSAECSLKNEIEHYSDRLLSIASDYGLLRGLVTSSPAFVRQLFKGNNLRSALSAKEQSVLLSYLQRSALKTSPFGIFTSVGLVSVEPDGTTNLSLRGTRTYSISRISRGLLTLVGLTRADDFESGERLRVNPSLRKVENGVKLLSSAYSTYSGLPWRVERLSSVSLNAAVQSVLMESRTICFGDLVGRLATGGLEDERARQFIKKLVRSGILLREARYDALDVEVPSRESRDDVHELARLGTEYADSTTESRLGILDAITRDHLGANHVDGFSPQTFVMEAGYAEVPDAVLGEEVRSYARNLASVVDRMVVYNPVYQRMLKLFVQRYGASGACDDVESFFLEVAADISARPLRFDNLARPKRDYALPATVFGQIVGSKRGVPKFVLNRLNPVVGALSARFLPELSKQKPDLLQVYAGWLKRVAAGREPIDVPVCGEVQDLQVHAQVTERLLAWPLEPIRAGRRVVHLAELILKNDVQRESLVLTDRRGTALFPMNLGAVLPHPGWGSLFYLIALSQPFTIRSVMPGGSKQAEAVVAHPRIEYGNVILARQRWSVKSSVVAEEWLSGSGSRRLFNVARALDRLNLPSQFFARMSDFDTDPRWLSLGNLRKPMWFDTTNPLSLEQLKRLSGSGDVLEITETLPCFFEGEDVGSTVSEIQFEAIFGGNLRVLTSGTENKP